MRISPYLQKKEFKAWLRRHKPEAVIGIHKTPDYCPIANYLRTSFFYLSNAGILHISVDTEHIRISDGFNFATPEWAKKFIEEVDNCPTNSITAQEALNLL